MRERVRPRQPSSHHPPHSAPASIHPSDSHSLANYRGFSAPDILDASVNTLISQLNFQLQDHYFAGVIQLNESIKLVANEKYLVSCLFNKQHQTESNTKLPEMVFVFPSVLIPMVSQKSWVAPYYEIRHQLVLYHGDDSHNCTLSPIRHNCLAGSDVSNLVLWVERLESGQHILNNTLYTL